jgi:hypothetical protein
MYTKLAYSLLLVIFFGILFFSIVTNSKIENQDSAEKISKPISEEDQIRIIFKNELKEVRQEVSENIPTHLSEEDIRIIFKNELEKPK